MSVDPTSRRLPIEDIEQRDPEWEEVQQGFGTDGNIKVYWDPIHGTIVSEGPIVMRDLGRIRRHVRPV
jgi:hypothetical protein